MSSSGGGKPLDAGASSSSGGLPTKPEPPVWVPLGTAVDCPISRVANAAKTRAFSWAPCEGTPGCEQMIPEYPWAIEGLQPNSMVREADGVTRVVLSMVDAAGTYVIFAQETGWVTDAYWIESSHRCLVGSGTYWGERYGAIVLLPDEHPLKVRVGGLVGSFGSSEPPVIFEVAPTPLGYGPGEHPMGPSRWLWKYTPDKLVSISTTDGSGLVTIAGPVDQGPLLALSRPITTGDRFLFGEVYLPEGGTIQGYLASSDGVSPPTPYLMPPDGSFYGFPAFADTHLVWFRGIGFLAPNKYQAVEIWASPYHVDPSALTPFKLADFSATGMADAVGGHGRFAVISTKDAPTYGENYVWDLNTQSRQSVVLPGGRRTSAYLGLTSKHLWVLGSPGLLPEEVAFRFQLN